jgi:hypothetical protein
VTSPAVTLTVQQLDEVIERAKDEVVRICLGGRWLMSVPAREGYDSDLLIMAALDAAQATVRRQQAALDAVMELADAYEQGRLWSAQAISQIQVALASPAPTEATT